MNEADIDVWGKCPVCGANWNMKAYSNITLSYVNKDGKAVWDKLGKFDFSISNPPFGQLGQTKGTWLKYNGVADLMALAVAMEVSQGGAFILPQMSLPFEFSGRSGYERRESKNFNNFLAAYPKCEVACSSLDTAEWAKEWADASPKVEVVTFNQF